MNTETKSFRAALFGSIYFIEGAILTYFSGFNALYLRTYDLSFTLIGIAGGIALLPFILKIFLGMLSDKVNLLGRGHRVPFMVIGILMQASGLFLVTLVNPATSFPLFLALLLFISLGMSTYDTCSDGLAIDTTPAHERGFVQGVMVASRALAFIVFASSIAWVSTRFSWHSAFLFMGIVTLLPLPLVLAVREKRRPEGHEFSISGFRSFLTRQMGLFLLLGLIYPLVIYSANGMLGVFLNETLRMDMIRVGLYLSLFGFGSVAGGLAGGPVADRLGRRSAILAALALTTLSLLAIVATGSALLAVFSVFLFGVAFGFYETVYQAAGMDFADPRIAATMFSVVMAVGNIGIGAGQPLAGILVDTVGFRGMFVVLCAVNLLSLPLVPLIYESRRA